MRGPNGFGVRLLDCNGVAFVEGKQDMASDSDLRYGDMVTAVNGVNLSSFAAVTGAIMNSSGHVELELLHAPEKMPGLHQSHRTCTKVICGSSAFILIVALGLAFANRDSSFTGVSLGPHPMAVDSSGAALNPHSFARAFRSKDAAMSRLRKERPELAQLLDAETLDVPRLQQLLRDDFEKMRLAQDLMLDEDGSAKDPSKYIEVVRRNATHMAMLKKQNKEVWRVFHFRQLDQLQHMLRAARQEQLQKNAPGPPLPPITPAPPPSPTPYDGFGDVSLSMRILTDNGERCTSSAPFRSACSRGSTTCAPLQGFVHARSRGHR